MSNRIYAARTSKSSQKPKSPRARQFAPFNALRGYYDIILERQRVKEPKREICEDRAEILSYQLSQVARQMVVKVEYYNHRLEAYETIEGMVTEFDLMFRTLTVANCRICFDDIWKISGDHISESPDTEI